jgi:hypothetical protein
LSIAGFWASPLPEDHGHVPLKVTQIEEVPMAKAKRKRSPNADLVEVTRTHKDQILKFYDQVEHERPAILLDFQRIKIRAYPLEKYKSKIRKGSHAMLDEEYKRAIAKNKILVLVWDDATRRLVTTTLHHD